MMEKMKEKMSAHDKITLLILVLMSVFLYADQNAINPVLNDIMQEYNIGDVKIGVIGSAFTIIGALVSLFFGVLTDRVNRKRLLVFIVLVGEIPCLLTGFKQFTQTYEQLLVLRILTGLGVGGIFPLTFSLVGDYFRAEHRAFVNALIGAAWAIGQIFGQTLAGLVASSMGWRFPFIIIASPNFLLVLLFALLAKEPKRGAKEEGIGELVKEGAEYTEKIKLKDFAVIFRNRTNLLSFLQGIPGSIPWGILPFYLITYYETVKHFSKEASTILTLVFGVGITVGGVLGGWVGERMYKRNPRILPVFCGCAVMGGVLPTILLLAMQFPAQPTVANLLWPAIFGLFGGVIVSLPSANVKTVLLNVNRPEHRGSVFSVFNITDSIGRGLGPLIGGFLIASVNFQFTMYFAALMWIPCGLLYLGIYWTLEKDLGTLKTYLNEKAVKLQRTTIQPHS